MINNVSLLFSLGAVLFVVVRAVMLDKTLPWFRTAVAKQVKHIIQSKRQP